MSISIYSLLSAVVLCLNALAILSESRFLCKFGLASQSVMHSIQQGDENGFGTLSTPAFDPEFGLGSGNGGGSSSPLKLQIAGLLHSIRMLLRWPLIFVNVLLIGLTLIFG